MKSNSFVPYICLIAAALIVSACATPASTSRKSSKGRMIIAAELLGERAWNGKPVDNANFMPVGPQDQRVDEFVGTLRVGQVEMTTDVQLTTRYPFRAELASKAVEPFFYEGADAKLFPSASIAFFTHDGYLVPVNRQVIRPPLAERAKGRYESFWDIVIEAGKVWKEKDDMGWNRASFPFALVSSLDGDTRNGLATFLYKDGKVSDMRFQIVQQTQPYMQLDTFNAWGQSSLTFKADTVADVSGLRKQYEAELGAKYEMRPFSELVAKYGTEKLKGFQRGVSADTHLGSALVVNKVIYYVPMDTPFGVYPYMENLRYGVWSVSKTFVAGVAMLRMAEKFGPNIYKEHLLDYFDPSENNSGHHGWDNILFTHCIDMNTGLGSPNGYWTRQDVNSWYYAYNLRDKLKHIFTEPDLPQGPGEKFVYNDEDIWILGVAMDRYLKKHEGPDASVLKMLADEVYRKIGVFNFVITTTYTEDGISPGSPHFSWGFLPTMDDLAKITGLMHSRGLHDGEQILHLGKMRDFFLEGDKKPIGGYMMAAGYQDYRDRSDGNHDWVMPAPGGMGGHQVVMMPNKTTALRFARNDGSPSPAAMIEASDNIIPFKDFKRGAGSDLHTSL